MRFDVLTLFPGLFSGYLRESLVSKAIERDLIDVQLHDFRSWTLDKHNKVDDRPYGGGPGMVIAAEPVVRCIEELQQQRPPAHLVLLTPQGKRFSQTTAERFAKLPRLMLLCGRYEGFDQRVIDVLEPEELSLGDFVLNGGEVAAMAVIESVMRLIPGTLGDEASHVDDSFSSGNRGLEYPHYTRPAEFRGLKVPEVLLSGNHQKVQEWRRKKSEERTRQRRSDLLDHEDPNDVDPQA